MTKTTFYSSCTSLQDFSYVETGGGLVTVTKNADNLSRITIETNSSSQAAGPRQFHYKQDSLSGKTLTVADHFEIESSGASFSVSGAEFPILSIKLGNSGVAIEGRIKQTTGGFTFTLVDVQSGYFTNYGSYVMPFDTHFLAKIHITDSTYYFTIYDENWVEHETITMTGRTGTNKRIYESISGKGYSDTFTGKIHIYEVIGTNADIDNHTTIGAYKRRVRKVYPSISIDYTTNPPYNDDQSGVQIFSRAITINNTSLTAKTDYKIPIIINTKDLYIQPGKMSVTGSDIRIYDTDNTTILPHWVESINTTYTRIWTIIPSLGTGTATGMKTIYLKYGNQAWPDTSSITAVWPILNNADLAQHYKGNEPNAGGQKAEFNGDKIRHWPNQNSRFNNTFFGEERTLAAHQIVPANQPTLQNNQVNGLPAIKLDGVDDHFDCSPKTFGSQSYAPSRFNNGISIFSVWKPDATARNFERIVDFGSGSPLDNIVLFRVATGNDLNFTSNLGTVSQGNVTASGAITNNVWQTHSVISGVGANNTKIYKNSSPTPLVTGTINNFANANRLNHYIGRSNWSADSYSAASFAELLIFQKTLTNAERDQVHEYLLKKYMLGGTAAINDIPPITIGDETVQSGDFNYIPFNQVVDSITINSKLPSNSFWGFAETTGNAKLVHAHKKTIASGGGAENWTIPGVGQVPVSANGYREHDIDSSGLLMIVDIEALDVDSSNRNDLASFNLKNPLYPLQKTPSTDDDFINIDIKTAIIARLNLATSYLEYRNVSGTLKYTVPFSLNRGVIANSTTLRFKKSDFSKTGTGTWTDASKLLHIYLETISGTQKIGFKNNKLIQNIDPRLNYFQNSNPVQIKNHISTDNGITYANSPIFIGRISQQSTNNEDITFDFEDYLKEFENTEFKDWPGWKNGQKSYLYNDYSVAPIYFPNHYKKLVEEVFSMIFPKRKLDIDIADSDSPVGYALAYKINATDNVATVLRDILAPCFPLIANKADGSLRIRSVSRYLLTTSVEQKIEANQIFSFKSYLNEKDIIVNRIKLTSHWGLGQYDPYFPRSLVVPDFQIVGFGGGGFELEANTVTNVLFRQVSDGRAEKEKYKASIPVGNVWVPYIGIGNEQHNDNGFAGATADTETVGLYIDGNDIRLAVRNFASSKRYIKSTLINADTIQYYPQPQVVVEDSVSRNKYGLKVEEIDSFVLDYTTISYALSPYNIMLNSVVNKLKNPLRAYEFSCAFQPNLGVGDVIEIASTEGEKIRGYIRELNVYQGKKQNSMTMRIIEI